MVHASATANGEKRTAKIWFLKNLPLYYSITLLLYFSPFYSEAPFSCYISVMHTYEILFCRCSLIIIHVLYRRCPVCNLPFNDAAFVRYPNGIVTHLKCGRNKTICPVTGTWFGE